MSSREAIDLEAFFDELQTVARVELTEQSLDMIWGAICGYPSMPGGSAIGGIEDLLQGVATLDRAAEFLELAERDRRIGPVRLRELAAGLPAILRALANELRPGPETVSFLSAKRRGRPTRHHDKILVYVSADAFRQSVGHVGISETGPFAAVLRKIWEVLPESTRPASADRLVEIAKEIRPHLRELGQAGC